MKQHPLPLHSPIELASDRFEAHGVPRGTRGYILNIYGSEGYEVQFFDADGNPLDWFAIDQSEARPIDAESTQPSESSAD